MLKHCTLNQHQKRQPVANVNALGDVWDWRCQAPHTTNPRDISQQALLLAQFWRGSKYLKTANWPIHPIHISIHPIPTYTAHMMKFLHSELSLSLSLSSHCQLSFTRQFGPFFFEGGLDKPGPHWNSSRVGEHECKALRISIFVAFLKTRTYTHYIYLSIYLSIYLDTYF